MSLYDPTKYWATTTTFQKCPELDFPTQPASRMEKILNREKFSDFTINCRGCSFRVHKAQLAATSEYFASLVDGGFSESDKSCVEFKETTPLAVGMLIAIMYLGKSGASLEAVLRLWPDKFGPLPRSPPASTIYLTRDGHESLSAFYMLEFKTLVEVYTLADRCLVSNIATALESYLLARLESCYMVEMSSTAPPYLTDALSHMYTTLPDVDEGLRSQLTIACFLRLEFLETKPEAIGIIQKHDVVTWRMGLKIGRGLKNKHDGLVANKWNNKIGIDLARRNRWQTMLEEELWKGF